MKNILCLLQVKLLTVSGQFVYIPKFKIFMFSNSLRYINMYFNCRYNLDTKHIYFFKFYLSTIYYSFNLNLIIKIKTKHSLICTEKTIILWISNQCSQMHFLILVFCMNLLATIQNKRVSKKNVGRRKGKDVLTIFQK